jgi:hypothetical protein
MKEFVLFNYKKETSGVGEASTQTTKITINTYGILAVILFVILIWLV